MTRHALTVTAAVLMFTPAPILRADDAPNGDKNLDGEWVMKSVVRAGKEAPADEPKASFAIEGGTLTLSVGARSVQVTIKADTTQTPKVLDMTPEDGIHKGQVMKAIYEIKGDELRTCHGGPGTDRPTEFASKEEGDILSVWTRAKK